MFEISRKQSSQVDDLEDLMSSRISSYKGMPLALSGGIDSSLIAVFGNPEIAISMKSPGGAAFDETKFSTEVANTLGIRQMIVELDGGDLKGKLTEAVRIIGEPIPHFSIYPTAVMMETLAKMGYKDLVLGDGPDETMCGYTRDLYLLSLAAVRNIAAFELYRPLIDKSVNIWSIFASLVQQPLDRINKIIEGYDLVKGINRVNIELMRPPITLMFDKLAQYYGITLHRPFEEIDQEMFDLPDDLKVLLPDTGKLGMRVIAGHHLPKKIALKPKVGGPVFPVNRLMGWEEKDGEFGKSQYMQFQNEVLAKT